ncbi:MAG: HEAT repeat domain-containing protein [Elusimicrobiota bacterium]
MRNFSNLYIYKNNIFARAQAYVKFIFSSLEVCSTGLMLFSFVFVSCGSILFAQNNFRPLTAEQALESKNPGERLGAMEAARSGLAPVSERKISQMILSEKKPLQKLKLQQALVKNDLGAAKDVLITNLRNDASAVVRQGAAQDLGNYVSNPDVISALGFALEKDQDMSVRLAAALSLGVARHSKEAFLSLEKFSQDSNADLRRQISFSVKQFHTPEAKKLLKQLRKDSDLSVRKMAGEEK